MLTLSINVTILGIETRPVYYLYNSTNHVIWGMWLIKANLIALVKTAVIVTAAILITPIKKIAVIYRYIKTPEFLVYSVYFFMFSS